MLPLLLSAAALAAPECKTTQTLTAASGSIQITEETYKNTLRQCWQLKPECPADTRLRLRFSAVDVETGYDFVQVWQGSKALSDSVEAGDTFTSDGSLTVAFSTDESTTRGGFTASWSCEGEPAHLDEYLSEEDVAELVAADAEEQHSALSALLSEIEADGLTVSTTDGVAFGEACGLVTSELEGLDWEAFAEKSRETIEGCDRESWTDQNLQDPGMAVLEVLMAGLVDLGLYCEVDLAERKGEAEEDAEEPVVP